MPGLDKAVSTEDLCAEEVSPALGVLRLEAILNTLVENKVESLKQETASELSTPKRILRKFKFNASSSPITTIRVINEKTNKMRKERRVERQQFKRQVLRQETSSAESQMFADSTEQVCYCGQPQNTDDYIAIKMDGMEDMETDTILAQEELKRARRKHKRRRKRRLKKRLALNAHLMDTLTNESEFKSLNDDELPPRAKWTIVATACLLLFMCLLLVGITLRMAPIIDEIVREENEKILNQISNSANVSATSVHSDIVPAKKLYTLNGVT